MVNAGGPPSIADFARQKRHEEYNAALQVSLPPSRSTSPTPIPTGMSFAGAEYQRGAFQPAQTLPARPLPHFQRRTLLDTFVDRDDTYWQTRVTLKIDVPYTDHSHIIGRQGKNTQKVMKETQCHIHFPDSNKAHGGEKSNQVSIAGPPAMVEKARHMIRQLAPLTVTFELKNIRPDVNLAELSNHPALEKATGTEGLHVLVRHNRSSGQPFALIRGSVHQAQLIKQAALNLMGLVFFPGSTVLCSTSLEILQPQQETVKGPANAHIQAISQRTGAAIHFPEVSRSGATSFFFQGTLDAILDARAHIIGCLPVFVIFELGLEQPDPALDLPELEAQYQLNLSIKLKKAGDAKTVVIRCLECNLSSAYELRHRLILSGNGGPKAEEAAKEPTVVCSDYAFMADLLTHPPPAMPEQVPYPHPSHPHMRAAAPFAHMPYIHPSMAHNGFYPPYNHYAMPSIDEGDASLGGYNGAFTVNQGDCALQASRTPAAPRSPIRAPHPTPIGDHIPTTPRASLATQLAEVENLGPSADASPVASSIMKAAKDVADRAPGSGRRIRFADYEEAKLIATRQMQSYPNGTRFPSSLFSGFGFSKTLNDVKLRAAGLGNRPNPMLEQTVAVVGLGCSEENGSATDTAETDDPTSPTPDWASPPSTHKRSFAKTAYFDSAADFGRIGGVVHCTKEVEAKLRETTDVGEILNLLQLGKYVEAFAEEEVDLETFLSLEEGDMKDTLGVSTIGARRKLLTAQKVLKNVHRAH